MIAAAPRRAATALLDVVMLMAVIMCIPFVIMLVGTPIVGIVWLLLQVGRLF